MPRKSVQDIIREDFIRANAIQWKKPDCREWGFKKRQVCGIILDPNEQEITWTLRKKCPKCRDRFKILTPEEPPKGLDLYHQNLKCKCGEPYK